jgi:hypothetical protein
LKNEPVVAGPPSRTYRLRKFVRRHKGVFAAIAALFVVLAVGFATTWYMYRQANTAEAQARMDRDRAESVVRFMKDAFRASDPQKGGDRNARISDVLETSVKKVRDGQFDKQPLIKADIENTTARLDSYPGCAITHAMEPIKASAAKIFK